jgi:hypothetical protein
MSSQKLHSAGFQISVWILLSLQIAGSIWGYGKDFSKGTVYSNIKNAASYIEENFPNSTVVSNSEVFASPLYAYLHPNKIYVVGVNKYVYFTSWKKTENVTPSEGELVDRAMSLNNSIIVTSYFPEITDTRVLKVKSFKGAVWGDNFEIYEITGTK